MRIRVEELFHEIADLPLEARARHFVERDIGVDTRREVEELVEFDSHFAASLESDIGQVANHAIARLETKDTHCGPYRLGDVLGRGVWGASIRPNVWMVR